MKVKEEELYQKSGSTQVNLDHRIQDSVQDKVTNAPDRYCFEEAVVRAHSISFPKISIFPQLSTSAAEG